MLKPTITAANDPISEKKKLLLAVNASADFYEGAINRARAYGSTEPEEMTNIFWEVADMELNHLINLLHEAVSKRVLRIEVGDDEITFVKPEEK